MYLYCRNMLLAGLLLFSISCGSMHHPEQLAIDRLYSNMHFCSDSIKSVIVLTEDGCSGCNIRFASTAQQYLNRGDNLIVVMAVGTLIDLNPFLKCSNVIFDHNNTFGFPSSSAIYLVSHQQIDSIIYIDPFNLDSTIHLLDDRLR